MMKRYALAVFALLLLACSTPEPGRVEVADHVRVHAPVSVAGDPPQLVTEDYLRRQLDIKMAQIMALPIVEAVAGPVHRYPSRIVDVNADTWDSDKRVRVMVVLNDAPGIQRHVGLDFGFKGANYDKGSGSVTEGACAKQPGAGVATTGEFTTVKNGTDAPIEHKISKTVEESNSTSTTLTESLELSSGVTIEAGTDFGAGSASVSATFSSTFGISQESTQDHSTTTSVTVEDTINVSPGKTVAITFTTDDAAVNCDITINAAGDWSDMTVWVSYPTGPRVPQFHRNTWGALHDADSGTYYNLGLLLQGDALHDEHGGLWIEFNEADQVYRFLKGYDVRCPHCGGLRFTTAAQQQIERLADEHERWVSFQGERHQTTKKDASYTALDVTGLDQHCVQDQLDDEGKLLGDIDRDGDGVPDACASAQSRRWRSPLVRAA